MSSKILEFSEIGSAEPSGEDDEEYGSIDKEAVLEKYDEGEVDLIHAQGLTENPITAGEDEEIDKRDAAKEQVANTDILVELSRELDAQLSIGESVNDIGIGVDPELQNYEESRNQHLDIHNDEELQQEIFEDAVEEFDGLHRGYEFKGAERSEDEQAFREFVIEYFEETTDEVDIVDGKYSVEHLGGFSLVSGSAHSEYWEDDPYTDEELDHIWSKKEEGRHTYFEGQGLLGELRDEYERVSETIGDAASAVQGVFDKVNRFLNGEDSGETSDDEEQSEEDETRNEEQDSRERPEDWGVEEIEKWVAQPWRDSKKEERMDILDLPEKHRKRIRKKEKLKELIRGEASGNVALIDGGLPKSSSPNFLLDKEDGEHRGSVELQELRDDEGLGRKIATYVGSYTEDYGQQKKDNADYINTHGTVTEIELDEEGRRINHQHLDFFDSDEEEDEGQILKNKPTHFEREEEMPDLWDDLEEEYDDLEYDRDWFEARTDTRVWGGRADAQIEKIEEEYEEGNSDLDQAKNDLDRAYDRLGNRFR